MSELNKNPVNPTKEAFFRDHLVPAGQVLEVLLAVAARQITHDAHTQLAHDTFEPLNLASVYAINPDNTQLGALADAVSSYVDRMLQVVSLGGDSKSRQAFLMSAFGYAVPSLSEKVRGTLRAALTRFQANLAHATSQIHQTIDFRPAVRHQWLESQVSRSTPLTRDGRANRWRTFVRNRNWTPAAELLGILPVMPASLLAKNRFNTQVGIATAAPFWDEVFAAITLEAEPEDGTSLPAGVEVASSSRGMLEVKAEFDPRQFLSVAQAKQLKSSAAALTPELALALQRRRYTLSCSLLTLSEGVAKAGAWLTEQKSSRAFVLELFAAWTLELKLASVRDKLARTFNAEERKLLAELFAVEAASV